MRPTKPIHFLAKALQNQPDILKIKRFDQHALLVNLDSQQQIAIYLLSDSPDLSEVEEVLHTNSAAHIHSVFAIPGDCLNDTVFVADVVQPLMQIVRIKNSKIYAYTILDDTIHILPVYPRPSNNGHRQFQFGTPVNVASFTCHWTETAAGDRIALADFKAQQIEDPRTAYSNQRHYQGQPYTAHPPRRGPVPGRKHYRTLRVSVGADIEQIRNAYRDLAQQYHPDANPDNPSAKQRMQEINEAYHQLMQNYRRSRK